MDDRWDYSLIAYLLLALSLLLMGTNGLAAEEVIAGPVEGEVVEVVDGDTVRVVARVWLDQNIEVLVRIRGIDAPERYGDCTAEREAAVEARETLAALFSSDRLVALSAIDRDKYFGRVVAEVTTSAGVSLGQHMLGSGWVRAYEGGARQPWCTLTGQLDSARP
jgi:endonuclease YncB( thermonuclease family)